MRNLRLVALSFIMLALVAVSAPADYYSANLQSAATTGNGTVFNLLMRSKTTTFVVTPAGTITGGVVTLETAPTETYSGTWAKITDVTLATNSVTVVQVDGLLPYVRARISTTVSGSGASVTVDVYSVSY